MTSSQAELPPDGPAGPPASFAGPGAGHGADQGSAHGAAPGLTAAVTIDDHLAPRVRLPADALRCALVCIEIVLVLALALAAQATLKGLETNVVGASLLAERGLLYSLDRVIRYLAEIALLILPLALAGRMLVRRQARPLAEAIGAGIVAAVLVSVCNALLRQAFARRLYDALTLSDAHAQRGSVLDVYLAGLIAFITVVGLVGRRRWRTAYWVTLGFYFVGSLAAQSTTLLSLLLTLLTGSAVGSGLRYLFGTPSDRPTAAQIAAVLSRVDAPVSAMRRIWDSRPEGRRYTATIADGSHRDVTVFDRDQQAADVLYRLYRRLRLKTQVAWAGPLTVERAVERRALLTYAVENAGVATPRLRALARVGPETAALANDHHDGTTLAQQDGGPTDEQLRKVWDAVLQLHHNQVTHRSLTADRILFTANGRGEEVMLLDPGHGDVAASDLQLRLDLTQLLSETALLVGPDRAAAVAAEKLSDEELAAMVPLLQPVALQRSTRMAIRRHKEILPELRKHLLGPASETEFEPAQLTRVRPRTVITMVATVIAAYILIGQLTKVNTSLLRSASPLWAIVVLALSVLTYFGATFELTGFVLERIGVARTFLVQVAGSFVTLVTPAAVGGVALNVRYLRRQQVSAPDAAASVGASQVVAFVLHMLLLIIFAALTGTSRATKSLRPPAWVWIALAVLAAAAGIVLAMPRPAAAAQPGDPDAESDRAAAAGRGAAAGQARRGHRRRAAAHRGLHRLPGRFGARPGRLGGHRQHRRGLPDRQRDRLGVPDPGRDRGGRGCAVGGADRGRPAGLAGPRRRAGLPAGHLLPARAGRLGGAEPPAAAQPAVRQPAAGQPAVPQAAAAGPVRAAAR